MYAKRLKLCGSYQTLVEKMANQFSAEHHATYFVAVFLAELWPFIVLVKLSIIISVASGCAQRARECAVGTVECL